MAVQAGILHTCHNSQIGNSGRIVAGVTCPDCGEMVIYNGNYFCSDWGYNTIDDYDTAKRYGGSCSWALAHPATSRKDRTICDALGLTYH